MKFYELKRRKHSFSPSAAASNNNRKGKKASGSVVVMVGGSNKENVVCNINDSNSGSDSETGKRKRVNASNCFLLLLDMVTPSRTGPSRVP